MLRSILVGVAIVLAAFTPARAETAKERLQKEHRKLEGTWRVVRGEMDGKAIPEEEIDGLTLTFKNGKFTARRGEEDPQEGSYTINLGRVPYSMDIERKDGPEHGRKQQAIYAVTGNRLEICSAEVGQKRPTAFSTRGRPRCTLLQLRRQD
jgi:uncharacterized protein (TIGR03067 family)